MAREKKIDGLSVAGKTAEREEFLSFPEPYITLQYSIVTLKDSATVATFADLAHKRIGILEASAGYSYLKKNYPDVELMTFKAYDIGLLAVLNGKIDAWIGSLAGVVYAINDKGLFGLRMTVIPYEMSKEMGVGIRKDWPELVTILNKAIASINQKEHAQIRNKWLYSSPEGQKANKVDLSLEERAFLQAHPEIVLGYTDSWEPEVIVNADGSLRGILVDILAELNERLGTNINIQIDPIPEVIEKAQNKEIDGILSLLPEYAEKLGLLKTGTYSIGYPAIFARKNMAFDSTSDFAGKRVAVIDKVFFSEEIIEQYGSGAIVIKVPDAKEGLHLVSNGQVDYFLGASLNAYLLSKYQLFDLTTQHLFYDLPVNTAIGTRSDWPEFSSILEKGLLSFSKEELDAIVARWSGFAEKRKQHVSIQLTPEEKAWLKAHPVIRFGIDETWDPFIYVGAQGRLEGFDPDIIKKINDLTGANIELVTGKWADLVERAKQRKIDGLTQSAILEERKEWFFFSDSYASHYFALVISPAQNTSIQSPSDLQGRSVAIQRGNLWARKLMESLDVNEIIEVASHTEATKTVVEGKADAAFIGLGKYATLRNIYRENIAVVHVFTENKLDVLYSIRNDWPELTSIVNKALSVIGIEERNDLYEKWTGYRLDTLGEKPIVALTPEERAWLSEKHTVRVRAIDFPPFIILGDDEVRGISTDYLRLISERTGIHFVFTVETRSFADALEGLQSLQGPDLITSLVPTPEREASISFSDSYFSSPRVIYVRDDSTVLRIDDLRGRTVAIPKNINVHKLLAEQYPEIKLQFYVNDLQALESVANGESDAFIGILTMAASHIRKHGLSNLKIAGPSPFHDHNFCFGSRKDWPELSSIINKGLATITPEEEAAIRNSYLAVRYEHGIRESDVVKWVLFIVGSAFLVVFLFVSWNRSLKKLVQTRTIELETSNVSLATEINERITVEQALIEKEAEERALIDAVKDSLFLMKTDGTIIVGNQELADRFDKSVSELIGLNAYDLILEDVARKRREFVVKAVASGKDHTFIDERAGRLVENRIYPLKNDQDRIEKVAVTGRDVTEEKLAQRRIEESELRFRATFDQAAVGIAHVSPDGHFLRINQKFSDIVGYSADELSGLTFQEITHPDDLGTDLEHVRQLLDGETDSYSMEKKYLHKGGMSVWVNLTVTLLRDDADQPNYFVSVIEDITDKRQLQEERDRILRLSPDLICIAGMDGYFKYLNPAWESTVGYTQEELMARPFLDFIHPDDHLKNAAEVERLAAGHKTIDFENRYVHKDGSIRNILWVATPLLEEKLLYCIGRDITDRKQAEEQIMQHQERLMALASQLTIAEEKERSRVAADLHDNIGQTLAFSRIQLARARKYVTEDKLKDVLDEISQSLLETIKETKDMVFDLSSPLLNEIGLGAAISNWLEEQVRKKHGINTEFIGVHAKIMNNDLRVILFRNIRELLANVIRHAQASNVIVSLDYKEPEVKVIVHDNGVGFNPDKDKFSAKTNSGFGLFSIRERMEDFGGSFKVESEPGKGCKVILTAPVK